MVLRIGSTRSKVYHLDDPGCTYGIEIRCGGYGGRILRTVDLIDRRLCMKCHKHWRSEFALELGREVKPGALDGP